MRLHELLNYFNPLSATIIRSKRPVTDLRIPPSPATAYQKGNEIFVENGGTVEFNIGDAHINVADGRSGAHIKVGKEEIFVSKGKPQALPGVPDAEAENIGRRSLTGFLKKMSR